MIQQQFKQGFLFLMTFLFMLSSAELLAQDSLKTGRINWSEVRIYLSEEQKAHPDAVVKAEWVLNRRKPISSLEDLSRSQQKRLKKRAARFDCSLVFIRQIPSLNFRGIYYVMCSEE